MKRLAQVLGLLGGIGAVIWAMRERFVSVAISREPEPPAFRAGQPGPALPLTDDAGSITDVPGIGPVYATRLSTADINTVADLAASTVEQVAEVARVPAARAEEWIKAAALRNL